MLDQAPVIMAVLNAVGVLGGGVVGLAVHLVVGVGRSGRFCVLAITALKMVKMEH